MKIKSNFKDYYDFVAHQFGGGDPRVIYNRIKLSNDKFGFDVDSIGGIINSPSIKTNINSMVFLKTKWLIITGRYFLLVEITNKINKWELYNELKHGYFDKSKWYHDVDIKSILGKESNSLIQLSKIVKSPVFCIEGLYRDNIRIESNAPILNYFGIPAILDPYQLYQDLEYFIGNTMNDNPDILPPVETSNNDRIVSHGFDLKKSFRHRVALK